MGDNYNLMKTNTTRKFISPIKVLLSTLILTTCHLALARAVGIPSMQEYGAVKIGEPCRVVNAIGNKLLFTPPGFDHQVLAINSDTPGAQGSAVFVDYQKSTSTVVPLPGSSGGWDIIEVSPGKLLFESISDPLTLTTIDTTNGNYKVESSVTVPGNQYAWQFAKGKDGKIYMGSYPTSHLYSYDPSSKKVEDLGKIGPDKNLYLRFLAFDSKSGLLLCVSGMSESQIVAYNVTTKKQTVVADQYPIEMHTIYGKVYAAIAKQIYVFDSDQMKMIPLTTPAPPNGAKWESMALASASDHLLVRDSNNQWFDISKQGKCTKVWDKDLRGGGIVAMDANGQIIGLRGQEYFVSKPLASKIAWRPIAENPLPVSIHFIEADPQGGVTGGPSFGQTLFRFDPARQLAQNTGQVADGGGEVYDGIWQNGKFYYVAYSGGYMGIWDPAQPWDQYDNKNPRVVDEYRQAKYGSLIRPIGGIVQGPNKKLYTGWSAQYGKIGGGLTEFDPVTEKSRSWTNERFAPEMSIGKIAADEHYIYGFTSNGFNGVHPPNKPVVFWVFDPATEKVLFKKQMNGIVFSIPETGHIWATTTDGIHRFNPEKMEFDYTIPWPAGTAPKKGISNATVRENAAWIAVDNRVIKLTDGDQPKLSPLFEAKSRPLLAAGYDGKLYFTQEQELWAAPVK